MTEMKKIDEIIREKGLKPSDCLYHTFRDAKNAKLQPTGKIRILVIKGDITANVEYVCPECSHYAFTKAEWKRPFSVKCEKCGFKVSVPKLRAEAKREMKKDNAK